MCEPSLILDSIVFGLMVNEVADLYSSKFDKIPGNTPIFLIVILMLFEFPRNFVV